MGLERAIVKRRRPCDRLVAASAVLAVSQFQDQVTDELLAFPQDTTEPVRSWRRCDQVSRLPDIVSLYLEIDEYFGR